VALKDWSLASLCSVAIKYVTPTRQLCSREQDVFRNPFFPRTVIRDNFIIESLELILRRILDLVGRINQCGARAANDSVILSKL
jgi:hypothetical protein